MFLDFSLIWPLAAASGPKNAWADLGRIDVSRQVPLPFCA